jgi:uncharacterized lipoprotein YmbA
MTSVQARSSLAAAAVATGAVLALAACSSSPSSRFYTLGGEIHSSSATPSPFYLEVAPVDMPQQNARTQIVVQTGPAQVNVLEDDRWASLPADEVRRALSSDLTQQLGTIDVYGTPHPDSVPVYRVKVNVQRFESWPAKQALIDAVWSVRGVANQAVLTCRTLAQQPVGASFDDLVAGHRRAVDQLAAEISAGVRTVSAAPMPAAPPAASKTPGTKPVAATVLPCPSAVTAQTGSTGQ